MDRIIYLFTFFTFTTWKATFTLEHKKYKSQTNIVQVIVFFKVILLHWTFIRRQKWNNLDADCLSLKKVWNINKNWYGFP